MELYISSKNEQIIKNLMKNIILGLNAIGINTSASLIIDNKLICAVEEERLNREKRTRKFPIRSTNHVE